VRTIKRSPTKHLKASRRSATRSQTCSEESKVLTIRSQVEAIFVAEENRIMMVDLSLMDLKRRAWFEKKQVMIRSCGV
jgi:hypothetical protein